MKSFFEPESRSSLLSRRRRAGRLVCLLLVACLSAALTGTAAARVVNRKISVGAVTEFQVSPDGRYVVFLADTEADGKYNLYSVPTLGTAPVRLNPVLAAGVSVRRFEISPDSRKVVYCSGPFGELGYCDRLVAVSIAGGSWVDLADPAPGGGRIGVFRISPNSQGVVYETNLVEDGSSDLWAVSMAGGSRTQLDDDSCAGCRIEFEIMPNNLGVVYRQYESGSSQLFGVSITGDRLHLASSVGAFHITPNGQRVIYIRRGAEHDELVSVQLSNGSTTVLNDTLVEGGNVLDFGISPNSQRVVYEADQEEDDRREIFSVPSAGGSAVRLNGDLSSGGYVTDFRIAPNSLGVVYRAREDGLSEWGLYAVPVAGGPDPIKLNRSLDVNYQRFEITPDSQGVVFLAGPGSGVGDELFAVGITGDPLVLLSAPLPENGTVVEFRIAPNSQVVAYRADQQIDQIFNLYAVSILGGTPVKLNGPLTWLGDVRGPFFITPNSKGVVYAADQETNDLNELFATLDLDLVYLPAVVR